MEPLEGQAAETLGSGAVSTKLQRIAAQRIRAGDLPPHVAKP
jgi:hypothetical protein